MLLPARSSLIVAAVLAGAMLSGCSAVPNMDAGTSGCSNAQGIGPRDQQVQAVEGGPMPELIGLSPQQAAAIAVGRGHTVVFNVPIHGFAECWCVPPPEGSVTEAFFTGNGALMLVVDGVDEGHTAAEQPPTGWGCA